MNSKNIKTSDCHRLLLNLRDGLNLKEFIKWLLYQILISTIRRQV